MLIVLRLKDQLVERKSIFKRVQTFAYLAAIIGLVCFLFPYEGEESQHPVEPVISFNLIDDTIDSSSYNVNTPAQYRAVPSIAAAAGTPLDGTYPLIKDESAITGIGVSEFDELVQQLYEQEDSSENNVSLPSQFKQDSIKAQLDHVGVSDHGYIADDLGDNTKQLKVNSKLFNYEKKSPTQDSIFSIQPTPITLHQAENQIPKLHGLENVEKPQKTEVLILDDKKYEVVDNPIINKDVPDDLRITVRPKPGRDRNIAAVYIWNPGDSSVTLQTDLYSAGVTLRAGVYNWAVNPSSSSTADDEEAVARLAAVENTVKIRLNDEYLKSEVLFTEDFAKCMLPHLGKHSLEYEFNLDKCTSYYEEKYLADFTNSAKEKPRRRGLRSAFRGANSFVYNSNAYTEHNQSANVDLSDHFASCLPQDPSESIKTYEADVKKCLRKYRANQMGTYRNTILKQRAIFGATQLRTAAKH